MVLLNISLVLSSYFITMLPACMQYFVSFGYFKYVPHYITQKQTDISPILSKGYT